MTLRIAIVLGSTRPGRRGAALAAWVLRAARAHGGAEYELIDLADHALGNLDEPGNPTFAQYTHEHTRQWSRVVDRFDGFVFVVPEYNHSFPGALKNAIDYVYNEWNDKAAGIVSYGGWAAGVRAAEALRLVLAEVQVATVRAQPAVNTHTGFEEGGCCLSVPDRDRSGREVGREAPSPVREARHATDWKSYVVAYSPDLLHTRKRTRAAARQTKPGITFPKSG